MQLGQSLILQLGMNVTALPTLPSSTQSGSTLAESAGTSLVSHAPNTTTPTSPAANAMAVRTLPPSTQSESTLVDSAGTFLASHAPHTTTPTSPAGNATELPNLPPSTQSDSTTTLVDAAHMIAPKSPSLLMCCSDTIVDTSATPSQPTELLMTQATPAADCAMDTRRTRTGHICKPSTHNITANAIGNSLKAMSSKCPNEHSGGSAGGKSKFLITLAQHALDQMLTFSAATTLKKPVKFSWLFTLTQHCCSCHPEDASENFADTSPSWVGSRTL
ncbi:hypothetical protein EDD22DRAFT_844578 [Suillus occidentalis]|nr:hypothetical protein EDD22DRAFT_844578 [Suillus occidentalis]